MSRWRLRYERLPKVLPKSCVAVREHGAGFCRQRLKAGAAQRAARGSLCAVAFTVIEADLEAFSPGRVAAVGVRGRAVIYIAKA